LVKQEYQKALKSSGSHLKVLKCF